MSPILSGLGGITVKGYGHFGPVRVTDTGAMFPLQVVTVGPAGASSVSFTNIPNTYSHLQLRYIGRTSRAVNNDGLIVKFNSSNSGYNYLGGHVLFGNGSSASSIAGWIGSSTAGGAIGQIPGANNASNIFGAAVVDILDYTNTNKHKTVRTLHGYDANGSGEVHLMSFSWDNTSAITSMAITVGTGQDFVANTQFALYGVKTA
jgi:hypothetical protein